MCVIPSLLANEVRAWLPYASRAVVRAGLLMLPARDRLRYAEEWLADVDSFSDRPLAGLVHAIYTVLSAIQVARALRPDQATELEVVRDDRTSSALLPSPSGGLAMRFVDPASYEPLAEFSCGNSTPYEHEVNSIVRNLKHAHPITNVRVAEDRLTGELLGLYASCQQPLLTNPCMPSLDDAEYLGVIAVSDSGRGFRVYSRRFGDILLEDSLEQIRLSRDGQMPVVYALLHRHNASAQRLFQNHGFRRFPLSGEYEVWIRPNE